MNIFYHVYAISYLLLVFYKFLSYKMATDDELSTNSNMQFGKNMKICN